MKRTTMWLSIECALASPDIHVSHWAEAPLKVAEAMAFARHRREGGYIASVNQ